MCRTVAGAMILALAAMCAPGLAAQATQPDTGQGAAPSSGQTTVTARVEMGLNVAGLRNEEGGSDSRIGLVAGGVVARGLTSVLGLQVGCLYSAKGVKSSSSNFTVALDYLEVPVLLTFTLRDNLPGPHPVFLTGPVFDFKLRTRFGDIPDAFQREFSRFVRDTEFGWLAGARIDIPRTSGNMTIEVRYTFGVTPVFDADPRDSDADDRNSVFAVVLGYRFRKR